MSIEKTNTEGLVKRCTTELPDGVSCGWYAFDQVSILVDGLQESAREPILAYSCRNCGHILPDGIPPSVYSQLGDAKDTGP